MYTPSARGCIPLGLGGVYPFGSGVYTLEARGCTPMTLGGVHPSTARFCKQVALVMIQLHYRSPRSHPLPQNRLWARSISLQKRRISANIAAKRRKHPCFRPFFGRIGANALFKPSAPFALGNAEARHPFYRSSCLCRATRQKAFYNCDNR